MRIPARLLVHSVVVRPFAGESSTGAVFGTEFTLQCMAQGKRRMVRNSEGSEVLSGLTLFCMPEDADRIPPGSEVDWQGDTTTVLDTTLHDAPGLPVPAHTEVVCE